MAARAMPTRSICATAGVKEVAVALRKASAGVKKAEAEKFKVMEVAEAAKWADVMMMLTPDELQGGHLSRPPRTPT